MLTPNTRQMSPLPTAHGAWPAAETCDHRGHVGTCAACQRRQIAKWSAQLQQATAQANER
jgi:hypothetical protein